ncbi:MAG: ATP-binding protein [Chlamydiales bacterium]|nr:ATP-binding protein [Chlamydiales bacterium]
MNPFKFGDPVEGEFYLEHVDLDSTVMQFITNRIHVVLIGPRRFGKTSFVFNLNRKMEKSGYTVLFVDIFNITSHRDFLQQFLRALKAKKHWLKAGKEWLADHRPKLSADIDHLSGQTSFGLSLSKATDKDVKEMIQDVLSEIKNLGKHVLLVIDEFQKITDLNDDGWLEATLRTHMQQLRNTSFLFTGSRKGIISDMLNNPARPLYRSCQMIDFPAFGEEFVTWIIDRFKQTGVKADRTAIEYLKKIVQETPNYVQMICFHLVASGVKIVNKKSVEETLRNVVQQNAYAYQTLLNTLSQLQQRVLRLAAIKQKQIFSKELLDRFEIPNAPALYSSIKALKSKGILDEEGTGKGTVIFDDPLFAIWLRVTFEEVSHE